MYSFPKLQALISIIFITITAATANAHCGPGLIAGKHGKLDYDGQCTLGAMSYYDYFVW